MRGSSLVDEAPKLVASKLNRRRERVSDNSRPGLRTFCNFVNERPSAQLGEAGNGRRLQFKYQIKAALWHRTKWGLHKKKTKLGAKQARYRTLRMAGRLFFRKGHSHFWTRNTPKPQVTTNPINPWQLETHDIGSVSIFSLKYHYQKL
jgi:hypothetical protein